MEQSFVILADLCYSTGLHALHTLPGGYLVCQDGRCAGAFETLPEQYQSLPLHDCSGMLALPGLTDLHVHAPQYTFRGLGMDLELLDWLNTYTFPEECRYEDLDYALDAYGRFVEDLRRGPNTRACIFATMHTPATVALMDALEDSGLCTMVGRVDMDRNAPPQLCQTDPEATRKWLQQIQGRYQNTLPILTPRFIPSCSDELLEQLHQLQMQTGLPVQSHLSENLSEIAWVQELCPKSRFYGDAYAQAGLFGGPGCPTIMAHCVHSTPEEMALMRQNQVFVAHCPASNTNLASGIAPVRRFLEQGVPVGLGSDVAGGTEMSIFRAMADAIQVSKLRWRLVDDGLAPLTVEEAFYLGTAGGGAFFGQVGSFAPGYAFDVLLLDDRRYSPPGALDLSQRLARTIYLAQSQDLVHKYVEGRQLF